MIYRIILYLKEFNSIINFILIKNIAIQYHHVLLLFWIEVKYNVGKTYILLIWHVVWPLSSVCRSNSSDTALSCRGQDRELTLTKLIFKLLECRQVVIYVYYVCTSRLPAQ